MPTNRRLRARLLRWGTLWLLASLVLAACGQQNETGGATTAQSPAAVQAPAENGTANTRATVEAQTTGVPGATEAIQATSAPGEAETHTASVETQTAAAPAATETATDTATAAAGVAVPEGSFKNPVLKQDYPDPHVIEVGDTYYLYATNGSGRNVQAARSQDLVKWELLTDAMPVLGKWVKPGLTWAPEVMQIGEQFILYYTARDKASNKQCVGVAVADKPEGKFKDTREGPLVCQVEEGGTIDASPFQDGDKLYLLYKNDGNCCGFATYLYIQEMAPDGLSLVGEPVRLVRNDKVWEGRVVEAPTMWKQDDQYYLFFSGNDYAGIPYAVGYATCESAMGPCEDAPENPILKSALRKPPVIGPGHQTIVLDKDGETWLVYHAYEVTTGGTKTNRRMVWIDQLDWENGKPVVRGPTTDPQPMP